MCTVSWAKRPNGYCLFFNRDESLERPVGLPPEVNSLGDSRFVCPRDPVGGGTWLLVNEQQLLNQVISQTEKLVDVLEVKHHVDVDHRVFVELEQQFRK